MTAPQPARFSRKDFRRLLARLSAGCLALALLGASVSYARASLFEYQLFARLPNLANGISPGDQSGADADALTRYRQLLERDGNNPTSKALLAEILILQLTESVDKSREAEAVAHAVVRLVPSDPFAWYRLALANELYHGTPTPLGLRSFEKSLALSPYNGHLLYPRLSYCLSWLDLMAPKTQRKCVREFYSASRYRSGRLMYALKNVTPKQAENADRILTELANGLPQ